MSLLRCSLLMLVAAGLVAIVSAVSAQPPKDGPKKEDPPPKREPGKKEPAKEPDDEPPPEPVRKQKPPGERMLRLHLMQGNDTMSGKLTVDTITVDTEFGKLEIPVAQIVSFRPGLNSHPKLRENIQRLILQLGANKADQRTAAQKELENMGRTIRKILEAHRDDDDPERRKRIGELLEQIQQQEDEAEFESERPAELIDEDTVQTPRFTVVGTVSPKSFQLQTKFGPLSVALADIRFGEQERDQAPEVRRTVSVSGQNLAGLSYKNSGVRVSRGDEIVIKADGSLIMQPWGNNMRSDPDGSPQYGQYKAGINGGALVARIGSSGQEFKVGKDHKFVAKKSGTLYFGVAMRPDFVNQGYQFPGEYKVRVRVNPSD